jgi:hypothetical protein
MLVVCQGGCHCVASNETVVLQTAHHWQAVVFDDSMAIAPIFMAMQDVSWFCFVFHDDGTMQLDGVWQDSDAD